MISHKTPKRGDVYWIDPRPSSGREMRGTHRFVVITPQVVNALGVAMTVPVTGGGSFARKTGMTVPIIGYDTQGVAVCNQVRTFDVEARVYELSGSRRRRESCRELNLLVRMEPGTEKSVVEIQKRFDIYYGENGKREPTDSNHRQGNESCRLREYGVSSILLTSLN